MKKYNIVIIIIYLFILLLTTINTDGSVMVSDEPIISIFQGDQPETSVMEVIWPDGHVDKLTYRDKDITNGKIDYIKWFNDCMDAYHERAGKL